MNRRSFLWSIGLGGAAIAANPTLALPAESKFVAGYPPLMFTGFRASQLSHAAAASFHWSVLWDDGQHHGLTFWHQQCHVDSLQVRAARDPEVLIKVMLTSTLYGVVSAIDGIEANAHRGLVENAEWEQEPNPDYDPTKPKFWEDENGEERYNSKTISTDVPIMKKVQRARLISWEDGKKLKWDADHHLIPGNAWEIVYPAKPSFDLDKLSGNAKEFFKL